VPVLVQVAGDDLGALLRVDDENAPARLDGRKGGAAAVEHDEVRAQADRELRALVHVRHRDGSSQPAAAATAADGLDTGERRSLQVVRGCMAPGARELEQRLEVRGDAGDLGLGRASPPHRDDDDLTVARVEPRGMSRDRGLPDPLARADDPDRRERKRLQLGWVEPEVGAHVGQSRREHAAREPEALERSEHRLVGEVDDELWPVLRERGIEVACHLDAVVGIVAQLLGAADDVGGDEVVGQLRERGLHHRRVMLSIDQGQGPHAPGRLPLPPGRAGLRRS
jgi:hypothetical protein